jgi:DNA-directed RNA polymerase subunit alpha
MAINIEYKESGVNKTQFIVSPLNQGDGNTLGNAMRRLLMSDMEGVAISAVKIEGVKHEMSTIPGVKEDVVDIVLNLKTVAVKALGELSGDEEIGILKGNGIGVLTAGDIQLSSNIEIINK